MYFLEILAEFFLSIWVDLNKILDSPKTISIMFPIVIAYYRHLQHIRGIFKEEIKDQVYAGCDTLYSFGYEEAEGLIFELMESDKSKIKIPREKGVIERELGAHLGEIRSTLQKMCETPLPKKIVKMIVSERHHYSGRKWEKYARASGGNLYRWARSYVSRRIGSSAVVKSVFSSELSEERFIEEYMKYVERARSFNRRII